MPSFLMYLLDKIAGLLVNLGIYNSKRVFIFTFNSRNYGTTLQNYALSEKLMELGYDPKTIRWGRHYYRTLGGRPDNLKPFWFEHVPRTKACYTQAELNGIMSHGNKIVFGGDAIFRSKFYKLRDPGNSPMHILRYYGDFVSGRKTMIAYAPSFGVDRFDGPEFVADECNKLIKRFDSISVREASGIEILKNKFGVDSVEAVDPVLLYKADKYEKLIENYKGIKTHDKEYIGYMVFVDNTLNKIRKNNALSHETMLNIRFIRSDQVNTVEQRLHNLNTVEQWLYNVRQAKCIITDSYHCLLFAIIFHRPFIAVLPEKSDSRIPSLLNYLGLSGQIKTLMEIKPEDFNTSTDWNRIDELVNKKALDSVNYLKEALAIKPSYKAPYVNEKVTEVRKRYDKAYKYRLKERKYYKLAKSIREEYNLEGNE